MLMKRKLLLITLISISVLYNLFAQKQSDKLYNLENDIAIQGYDAVSYFTMQKPVKGNQKINTTLNGAIYYFSSQENLSLFLSNPVKYEPQYGGWCAYAIGDDGSRVKIDPKTYKIVDGKLYLFYNFHLTNTLKKWNKNEKELKEIADRYWDKMK